jgi:hypothetical protein
MSAISAAMTARWVILLAISAGCASGGRGNGTNGDDRHDAPPGAPIDGKPGVDARPGPGIDAAPIDSPGGGGGLDPELELPDPGGQVCTTPGSGSQCPAGEVCRYFTPTEGRCEGCTSCGLRGTSCTATEQCDISLECYQGRCTEFCTLGTIACGTAADCIDIGHATRGVCRP